MVTPGCCATRGGSRVSWRGNRAMMDKVLAIFFMAALIVFMGVVVVYINEPALWIIVSAVLVMGVYDFYTELRSSE